MKMQAAPTKVGQENESEDLLFSFETLYTLWSPRDDARTAVIQMFCDWFQKEQETFQYKAQKWFHEQGSLYISPKITSECCIAYLNETMQQDGMTKWATVTTLNAAQQKVALSSYIYEHVKNYKKGIREIRLWDDGSDFLSVNFEHFQLEGIAHDFSVILSEKFDAIFQSEIMQQTYRVTVDELTEKFDARTQVFNRKTLGNAAGVGLTSSAVGYGLMPHAWSLLAHVVPEISVGLFTSLSVTGGVHLYQSLLSRSRRRSQLVQILSARIQTDVTRVVDDAFTTATFQLTPQLARDIIGSKTLVKKRALDYASEGQFLGGFSN